MVHGLSKIEFMFSILSKMMLVCGPACLLLVGCASPQGDFQTKRDPAYHSTLERVLIVSLNEDLAGRLGHDFSNRLLARATGSFSAKGISTEVVHQNKNDLDPLAAVKPAVERFNPGQLLYIAITRVASHNEMRAATAGTLPQYNSVVSIAFSFNLADTRSGKIIWRGTEQFDSIPSAEDVADQLIKQLETEHLL
jgi:hypothetical protein